MGKRGKRKAWCVPRGTEAASFDMYEVRLCDSLPECPRKDRGGGGRSACGWCVYAERKPKRRGR